MPAKTILGSGESHGGHYKEIKVYGSGEFFGSVECGRIRTRGSCVLAEDLKAGSASTAGSVEIGGNLTVGRLKAYGSMEVGGGADGGSLHINGSCEIRNGVRADSLVARGSTEVGGDVEATRVEIEGRAAIRGLLSADEMRLEPHWRCIVEQIGGGRLTVRPARRWFWFGPRGTAGGGLRSRQIEVDEVDLTHTMAEVVRCRSGRIGPGCRIRTLYSDGEVEIHPRATVEEQCGGARQGS